MWYSLHVRVKYLPHRRYHVQPWPTKPHPRLGAQITYNRLPHFHEYIPSPEPRGQLTFYLCSLRFTLSNRRKMHLFGRAKGNENKQTCCEGSKESKIKEECCTTTFSIAKYSFKQCK